MSQSMSPTLDNLEAEAAETNVAEERAVGTAVMNPEFNPETFSVDNYADRLMDDVFVGVEHLLETGMELPTEKPEPDYVSVQTIKMPEVVLPLSVIPEGALAAPEAGSEKATETAETEAQPQPKDWGLRILSGLVIASFAGAATMVATQWQSYRMLYLHATGQAVTETVAVAPAPTLSPEVQFATYVQRSLEVLKDQTAINQASGRVVIAPPPAVLQVPPAAIPSVVSTPAPTAPIAPVASVAPSSPKTVVERIYIPVYQTPNGFMPVDPSVRLSPEVAAAGALPAAQPPAALSVPGVPLPQANASADSADSAVSVASAQQTSQLAEPAASSPEVTPETPIVSTYTLVGLLELGNGSAALVEVNGVTRRLSLGERIGGWNLAEVKDGEAVFRRNGEVRSIFVGQTF